MLRWVEKAEMLIRALGYIAVVAFVVAFSWSFIFQGPEWWIRSLWLVFVASSIPGAVLWLFMAIFVRRRGTSA